MAIWILKRLQGGGYVGSPTDRLTDNPNLAASWGESEGEKAELDRIQVVLESRFGKLVRVTYEAAVGALRDGYIIKKEAMARYIATGIWVRTIEVEAGSEDEAFKAAFTALNDKPTKRKVKKLGLGFSNWHVHKLDDSKDKH